MERDNTRLYWERLTGRATSNSSSRMRTGIGETKEEAKEQDSASEDEAPPVVIAQQKSTTTKTTAVIGKLPTATNMSTMTTDHNVTMKYFIEDISKRAKGSHMDLAMWIYCSEDKLVTFEETVNNIRSETDINDMQFDPLDSSRNLGKDSKMHCASVLKGIEYVKHKQAE